MNFVSITMIQTATGSPDGLSVRTFDKGKQYELPESLAAVFVDQMQVAKYAVIDEAPNPRKKREPAKAD
jgi:hypothetical protein